MFSRFYNSTFLLKGDGGGCGFFLESRLLFRLGLVLGFRLGLGFVLRLVFVLVLRLGFMIGFMLWFGLELGFICFGYHKL